MGDWHNTTASIESLQVDDLPFRSRRSPVLSRHASVATSQPLATSIGIDLLRQGANAADVAVAVAATLAVVEPCSTGLGGDMFCLFYKASEKKVYAINGSGCAPMSLTLDRVLQDCPKGVDDFKFSPHAVTVPGAARGWEDTVKKFGSGKFSLAQILEPAAQLAEEGFPVSPVTSHHWASGKVQLDQWNSDYSPLTNSEGNTPKPGEVFQNPDMAAVLRSLGAHGATDGFYGSKPGQAIVEAIQQHGGLMTMEDLNNHSTLFPEAISAQYRNVLLWQVPPNGQGIAALIGLTGLASLEEEGVIPKLSPETVAKTAESYHVQLEMIRLGFGDARTYVSCPGSCDENKTQWLLDKERISNRAKKLFDPTKATSQEPALPSSDTVSFQVVDSEGNAISFVNSNFNGFGTGICPAGCGFSLQNRGFNFSLDKTHRNVLSGGKRPYHTIIPGMLTYADSGDLYATLSNMGGFMQPQGHLQLTVNLVAGGMDPQEAIDTPRFCIPQGTQDGQVQFETGIPQDVLEQLQAMGHNMVPNVAGHARSTFGRAQIIKKDPVTGVLWAGSDGRGDGCAMGF